MQFVFGMSAGQTCETSVPPVLTSVREAVKLAPQPDGEVKDNVDIVDIEVPLQSL